MIITIYCLAILFFCLSFFLTKLVSTCIKILALAKHSVSVIFDRSMSDISKEKAIKTSAINMVRNSFKLILKLAITILITIAPLIIADKIGYASLDKTTEFSLRIDVLLITTIVMMSLVFFLKIITGGKKQDTQNNGGENKIDSSYSTFDKFLHNMAFSSSILQRILGDIEKRLYSKTWKDVPATQPIFITSLPRAGTTIILEALHCLPGLATHTYRDMPFIHSPVLWSKLSSHIKTRGKPRERAHGDGLYVSEDSPEAFEEVLWCKYFPKNYAGTSIPIWSTTNKTFTEYFHEHMRKIIILRQPQNLNSRYVSKNNGNISRIRAINAMFPDAKVIVPLRNPIEHAISLLRQHTNFLKLHATDDFSKLYMADIGHFEFGELHHPIQFTQFKTLTEGLDAQTLDYWIGYWIAAFEHLGEQDRLIFLSYEKLCLSPISGLTKVCEYLNINSDHEDIINAANIFRPSPNSRKQEYSYDNDLAERADGLFQKLLKQCLLSQP